MSVSRGNQRILRGKKGSKRRQSKRHWEQKLYELIALEPRVLLSISPSISGAIEVDDGNPYALSLSATGTEVTSINHWEVNWGDGNTETFNIHTGTVTHPYPNLDPNANPPETEHDYTITAKAVMNNLTQYPNLALGVDNSFDLDGKVTQHPTAGTDQGYAMAVQPDGKIVVAGVYNGNDFGLMRFQSNGKMDTSFGTGGIVHTDFNGGVDKAYAVAIDPNGKIVVAGSATSQSYPRFALARYLPDGTLDTSFNQTGKVITTGFRPPVNGVRPSDFDGAAYGLTFLGDGSGRIVAVGYSYLNNAQFAIAQYNSDGTLDNSFGPVDAQGAAGRVAMNLTGSNSTLNGYANSYARAVVIDSNGKLVVGGGLTATCTSPGTTCGWPYSEYDFVLTRLNSSGQVDTTFGTNGEVATDFSSSFSNGPTYGSLYGIVLKDDKIIAAGNAEVSLNNDFALARYNSNGTLDTSFGGGDGLVNTDFTTPTGAGGSDFAYGITMTSAGDLVLAGSADRGDGSGALTDMAMAKYHQDGSLDTLFGHGGKLTTNVELSPTNDVIRGLALVSDQNRKDGTFTDRRIVVAGYAGSKFALARYQLGNRVAVTPLAPPWMDSNTVTATRFSTTRIDLNWDAQPVSGQTYTVYRGTDPASLGDPATIIASGLTDTTFPDTTVSPGTEYFYAVEASGPGGSSYFYDYVSQVTGTDLQPTNLVVQDIFAFGLSLYWTDVSSNETGYIVQRQNPDNSWDTIQTLPPDSEGALISDLSADSTYNLSVTATFANSSATGPSITARTVPLGHTHDLVIFVNGHRHTAATPSQGGPNDSVAGIKHIAEILNQDLDGERYLCMQVYESKKGATIQWDATGPAWDFLVHLLDNSDTTSALNINNIAVIGYSHGASIARRLVEKLGRLKGVEYSWNVTYLAYVDAVQRNDFHLSPPASETRVPDRRYFSGDVRNFYQLPLISIPFLLNLHGNYINETNVLEPGPDFGRIYNVNHFTIDENTTVQNTIVADVHGYVPPPLP